MQACRFAARTKNQEIKKGLLRNRSQFKWVRELGIYESTLEDIENTLGIVPGFMKVIPEEKLIRDWPSWKECDLGEIDMERSRYLLCVDEMLFEMLGEI